MPKKFKKKAVDFGAGIVSLGVSTAVGAGVQARLPPGALPAGTSLTTGFATAAGFTPIIGTAVMGGEALRLTKKLNQKQKKKSFGKY